MAGSWFVVCSDAGGHAGAIGREGNRPALGGPDVFQREKQDSAGEAGGVPAARKKISNARGERSERPVALPAAPARLIKPGCAAGPAAGDLGQGAGRDQRRGTPVWECALRAGQPRVNASHGRNSPGGAPRPPGHALT